MEHENPEINEIYQLAGEHLSEVLDLYLVGYFEQDIKKFSYWWHHHEIGEDKKSPKDFCEEGKQRNLEIMLMDVFTAAHGG